MKTFAIFHPGEMGAALGAALASRGFADHLRILRKHDRRANHGISATMHVSAPMALGPSEITQAHLLCDYLSRAVRDLLAVGWTRLSNYFLQFTYTVTSRLSTRKSD
jgi:hypothetical protein